MRRGEPVEIELKLAAPDPESLAGLPAVLSEFFDEVRAEEPAELRDIYVDTEDWRLFRAGLGCRARVSERGMLLTLKGLGGIEGGWASRFEVEEWIEAAAPEFPGPAPGREVAARLAPAVGGEPLRVKVELRKEQRAYRAATTDGVEIKATADRVQVASAGVGGVFGEIELEYVSGDAEAFHALAESVAKRLGLARSSESKYARALRATGMRPPSLEEGDELRIRPTDRLVDAAYRALRRHFARMLWNDPGTRMGLDPEFLHDMRVACRRVLAALRVFGKALPARRRQGLQRDITWLARELGRVRDLDIGQRRVEAEAEELGGDVPAALKPYREHLYRQHVKARRRMLRALDSRRFARFVDRLQRFLDTGPPRRPSAPTARETAAIAARRLLRGRLRRFLAKGSWSVPQERK